MRITNTLWIVTLLSLMFGQGQCFVVWMLSRPSSKSLLYAAVDTAGNEEPDREKVESPSSDLIRPLAGGPSLIFAMAQRLNLWDDILNDSSEKLNSSTNKASSYSASLPRFRQSSQGISNVNPNFRTSSPIMNKKGYASSIIRNARKKNKPGLWRYSLRTYQKLRGIELMNTSGGKDTVNDGTSETDNEEKLRPADHDIPATNSSSSTYSGNNKSSLMIYRENEHFQGVLVAVAKLGLWQEALNIYNELEELIVLQQACKSNESLVGSTAVKRRKDLKINNSMVVSVIDACVRGMKLCNNREPLDHALKIILTMKDKHKITPTHVHMNKLAAGYQYLGLHQESDFVIQQLLKIEQDFVDVESTVVDYINLNGKKRRRSSSIQFTNFPMSSSSKSSLNEASFKILVQNSIREGDWAKSVQHLRQMTEEEGIYPRSRTLNVWSEAASKRERRPKKNKWIKNRERILVKGLES